MPNRLIHEDSPYLQQHAKNPVDWYPWSNEAFSLAKTSNRPIFLSIGYSSCHWCHVMEHEVFENAEIAEYLNAHFVSIKVDREERPDIDKHFQEVHQLLNQRPGGWPTSIFLTPDQKPFFAGTYIPPKRQHNMVGFLELIGLIDQKWQKEPEALKKNADEIQGYLQPKDGPVKATKINLGITESFMKQAKQVFDPVYGGFSHAPKFPHTSTINLLLDLYGLENDKEALDMAADTLRHMAKGGIWDLVDGGFCRYSVDEMWLVPHFEKMGYDNGLLCETYLKAYRATGDLFFLNIAKSIIAFMQERMQRGQLFYSASDADTEGEEGKYFVYGYNEVLEAFKAAGYGDAQAADMANKLSISKFGNFEGHNIVRNEMLATYPWFDGAIKALRQLRSTRTYPFIDKKVIVAWNAMMIKSLFLMGTVEPTYLQSAEASLEALLTKMLIKGKLHHSALVNGEAKIDAFLEDYAYLCDALITANQTTLETSYLESARKLADRALEIFYEEGKWFFSRGEFPTEAEIADTSYPASSAMMVSVLLRLGALADEKYRTLADKSLQYYSPKTMQYPLYHALFAQNVIRYLKEEVVVKAKKEALETARATLSSATHPYLLKKVDDASESFQVCNQHSCFANAYTAEALSEAIAKI